MDDNKLTTEYIRGYIHEGALAEFDRWLTEHDAEIRTAALEEAAGIVKGNLGRIWIATETLGDIADAIRAAKVDPS